MFAAEDLRHDRLVTFGGLGVPIAPNVLAPRRWTLLQSRWAAELLRTRPPGPILEVFAGAGHIGLEAARRSGRKVVLVDVSPDACALAMETSDRNGMAARTEVRLRTADQSFEPRDRPAIVIADPPYVPSPEVRAFPQDPSLAIDGGPDGLAQVRGFVRACATRLAPGTPLLLQVRGPRQAATLRRWLRASRTPIDMLHVRAVALDRAVVLLEATDAVTRGRFRTPPSSRGLPNPPRSVAR